MNNNLALQALNEKKQKDNGFVRGIDQDLSSVKNDKFKERVTEIDLVDYL